MGFFYAIIRFFQMGGFFMYPILVVLMVGLAIAFERWVQLNRTQSANKKIWDSLYPVMAKGDFNRAREMAGKDKSSMAQMLNMGLARQGAVRRREDIEIAMEETMMEIIPYLSQFCRRRNSRMENGRSILKSVRPFKWMKSKGSNTFCIMQGHSKREANMI